MNWKWFGVMYIMMQTQMLLEGLLTWHRGLFSPKQMLRVYGQKGTPFLGHPAMWSDFFGQSLIISLAVGWVGPDCSPLKLSLAAVFGYGTSHFMHETYKSYQGLDCLVMHGKVQPAGQVHVWYMAEGFAAYTLYYCRSMSPDEFWYCAAVSAALVIHTLTASHLPVQLWGFTW